MIASRCNGCGYCEQRCPVAGESAIVVVTDGEIRLKEGSYIAESRRLGLEFRADPGDDRFEIEDYGAPPAGKPAPQAPKGFL